MPETETVRLTANDAITLQTLPGTDASLSKVQASRLPFPLYSCLLPFEFQSLLARYMMLSRLMTYAFFFFFLRSLLSCHYS